MLIINNGVPKSGSSWIQTVLTRLYGLTGPSDPKWLRPWTNPSIDDAKLSGYLATGESSSRNVILKAHYRPKPELKKLFNHHGVKLLVSYRNMPDTIVSLYHHEKKHKKLDMSLAKWLASGGDIALRDYLSIRTGWQDMSLMIPFEEARNDPALWAARIGEFIEVPPQQPVQKFCAQTLSRRTQVAESKHIRTGGAGAANELPDYWRKVIEEIEAETLASQLTSEKEC
tara:strand:- start:2037 stop:2720 length:684 start_codon:yes stop_codon:yes gene_type:complete